MTHTQSISDNTRQSLIDRIDKVMANKGQRLFYADNYGLEYSVNFVETDTLSTARNILCENHCLDECGIGKLMEFVNTYLVAHEKK